MPPTIPQSTIPITGTDHIIFLGLPVCVDDSLGITAEQRQYRFPRSKRRRIRRKWAKDPANFVWVRGSKPYVVIVNSTILCNSAGLLKLSDIVDRGTP